MREIGEKTSQKFLEVISGARIGSAAFLGARLMSNRPIEVTNHKSEVHLRKFLDF